MTGKMVGLMAMLCYAFIEIKAFNISIKKPPSRNDKTQREGWVFFKERAGY